MGFFSRLFGGSKQAVKEDEAVEQEVEKDAVEVIQIDERVIESINEILRLLDALMTSVQEDMEPQHSGSQRLGRGMIRGMKQKLNQILETRSVSQEYSEIRYIMANFAKISIRFKTLPYYDPTFQNDLTIISQKLHELEHFLQIKKSILEEEFSNIKGEQ